MQMSYAVLLLLSKVTQRHFRHSASKVHCALPRAQHGLCSSIPCWCSLILSRTQRIARARNTLFMWTISSLARIFPYATSNNFLVATTSATSFLSSAVMYLWGQLSYIRRCCRRCFRVVVSHFGSLWAEVNLAPSWHEAWGENKKDPYLHTRITGNTKKRTAHVR